jgi:hypothetical protein
VSDQVRRNRVEAEDVIERILDLRDELRAEGDRAHLTAAVNHLRQVWPVEAVCFPRKLK